MFFQDLCGVFPHKQTPDTMVVQKLQVSIC